jgi:hypothetical protein
VGKHDKFRVNDWTQEVDGLNHHYSYNVHPMPPSALKNGDNEIAFRSDHTEHACEVLWPGPGLVVRYRK